MINKDLNESSNIERIELKRSFFPLEQTLEGENLKIYEKLSSYNKLKSLNLELISKLDKFNDVYISIVYDNKLDEIIILYHVHRKFFNNSTSYERISREKAEKDLYKTIFALLKKYNADPTIVREKLFLNKKDW